MFLIQGVRYIFFSEKGLFFDCNARDSAISVSFPHGLVLSTTITPLFFPLLGSFLSWLYEEMVPSLLWGVLEYQSSPYVRKRLPDGFPPVFALPWPSFFLSSHL